MKQEVILLPSFAQVDWWRKQGADRESSGLFACTVTTFNAWIADLWELFGDGRLIVDNVQRNMLMHAALASGQGGTSSSELVPTAVKCVQLAAGLPEFTSVVDAARLDGGIASLSERELFFVRALARYFDLLMQRDLIEFGDAVAKLASKAGEMFPEGARVLMPQSAPLGWLQEHFFDACDAVELTVEPAVGIEGVGRAPSGVDVRFACPSGHLAQPGLIADVIEQMEDVQSVVVTCADPLDLFSRLEERLGSSRRLDVQARKAFGDTDFGSVLLAFCECLQGDVWDPAVLSDVLRSPFSGISRAEAISWDGRLRADRLVRREEVFRELRAESELFSRLEQLANGQDADVLCGSFEQRVMNDTRRGVAWRVEQLAALSVLRQVMHAACGAGCDMAACISLLERATVPVAVRSGGDGPQVLVTTQDLASQLEPGGFDVLVAADLTSDSYPVGDRDDAVSTFFDKLGLVPAETALMRARRVFCALLELPSKRAVFVRPLGDENASKTYPAAVLEEFVDAYRADPTNADDIDNDYLLPGVLREGIVERGEELLLANARSADVAFVQPVAAELPLVPLSNVPPDDVPLVVPPRRDAEGNVLEKACPSPSQIELYLDCPYRWFAERRMRPESLDEEFGPLERGSFMHSVLEEFYRRFQSAGHLKVSDENMHDARALMGKVFDELALKQRDEAPGSGRYVAVTEMERRELEALRAQLLDYLDFEKKLLPSFHPAYLEYEIDAEHAVDYAGYLLVGKVDRIDVDEAGHAVIIDYKGSVSEEHKIAGKGWGHAGKVQTRVYARVVERALGLSVVGALYVSYGRKVAVAGSYDPRVLGPVDLPGINPDRCACGTLERVPVPVPDDYSLASLTFQRMLDETEAIVGEAVSAMTAGDVDPRPSHVDACNYCQALSCPKRGA